MSKTTVVGISYRTVDEAAGGPYVEFRVAYSDGPDDVVQRTGVSELDPTLFALTLEALARSMRWRVAEARKGNGR